MYYTLDNIVVDTLPSFIAYFDVRIIDSVSMNQSIIEYHLSMQSWWPGHI